MRTLFVTCLYSKLFGSEFGGRDSRDGHYKNSLKSLLKMFDAKFICYTSEDQINDLKSFFYKQNKFSWFCLLSKFVFVIIPVASSTLIAKILLLNKAFALT